MSTDEAKTHAARAAKQAAHAAKNGAAAVELVAEEVKDTAEGAVLESVSRFSSFVNNPTVIRASVVVGVTALAYSVWASRQMLNLTEELIDLEINPIDIVE